MLLPLGRSGLSSCGLRGHTGVRAGRGPGMRCLHSSHTGFRGVSTAVLGRQHRRDAWATAGVPPTAAELRAVPTAVRLGALTHERGHSSSRKETQRLLSPGESSSPSLRTLRLRNAAQPSAWGPPGQQRGQTLPDRAVTATDRGGGPVPHPARALATARHTSDQGHNGQRARGKGAAGLRAKSSARTQRH